MGIMAARDPDCGECKTLEMPSGKKLVLHHPFPKALEHFYPLPALDAASMPLYRGQFSRDSAQYRGIVTLEFDPTPSLVAQGIRELTGPEELNMLIRKQEPAKWVEPNELKIPSARVPSPAKTPRPPRAPAAVGTFSTHIAHLAAIDVGDGTAVDQVTFYLLNGWFSLDGLSTCYDGVERRGRIDIALGDWQLRIEPRGDVSQDRVRQYQRETGRSTVTHVGRLRRDDEGQFDAFDAIGVLDILEAIIGFALGRVTAIVLPVGFRGGKAIWTRWHCNRAVDRPLGTTPFLDDAHAAAQVGELLRAGFSTSTDSLRWNVFESALGYHYATEHDATVNMKVMLPVSALQLVSYAHLVEELPSGHPDHLTHQEWNSKQLRTVGQLRRLLNAAGIDTSVPTHLSRLGKVQSDITHGSLPAPDALDCVVRLRNNVAHPKQKDVNKWTTEEWAEAGFAATTMFNLTMLWWLRYDERYLGKTSKYGGADASIFVPWH